MAPNSTASLFDVARCGTLDQQSLDRFLDNENENGGIDKLNPKGLTALALAAVGGHVDTVQLLLSNGADVNKQIKDEKTVLSLVAGKTSRNRPDIIGLLLEAGAGVDATSWSVDSNTPLMLAIKQFPDDEKSIKLLLRKKPSLDAKRNKDGDNVISLARKTSSRVLDLVERRYEKEGFAIFIGHIMSFILHILGLVNAFTGGIIERVFHINPPIDRELDDKTHQGMTSDVPTPTDCARRDAPEHADEEAPSNNVQGLAQEEDFLNSAQDYLDKTGLNNFFSKDSSLLQEIAAKAVELRDNPNTTLGQPPHINNVINLSMYQPVLLLDDSGSMLTFDRFEKQAMLVERICRITTYLVPDKLGVDVYFINKNDHENKALREKDIGALMTSFEPSGPTELGYNLERKILKPLIYDVVNGGQRLERPLLISIITDGCPNGALEGEGMFVDALKKCRRFLLEHKYPPTAVRFQISKIGSETLVSRFLDELRSEPSIQDIIFCTTDRLDEQYEELRANDNMLEEWLLKTLVGPILKGMPT